MVSSLFCSGSLVIFVAAETEEVAVAVMVEAVAAMAGN
jgi:hypothetical protein